MTSEAWPFIGEIEENLGCGITLEATTINRR